MNTFKNINKVILCFIFYVKTINYGFAQNGGATLCNMAEPLCGVSQFSYPNTSGTQLPEDGPDFGCLRLQMNPAWFYFQVAQGGDIQFKIEQSETLNGQPNLDVDFILYGPFDHPQTPCESELNSENIVDCSFSSDSVEFLNIPYTFTGEYYLIMITNFSFAPGFITVTQTSGNAATNCNLLTDPEIRDLETCSSSPIFLDAFIENAHYYQWYEGDSLDGNNFSLIEDANDSTYEASETKVYKAQAFNSDNVFLKEIQFNIIVYESPQVAEQVSDYVICMDSDNLFAEFDLAFKDSEILGGLNPDDFVVSYHKDENEAELGIEPLPTLYTNTNPIEIIYARLKNTLSSEVICYQVTSFLLMVDKNPEVELNDSYILCVNTNGTEIIETSPIIDTQLSNQEYTFYWYLDNNLLPSESNSFLIPKEKGIYKVEVIRNSTNCIGFSETRVNLSEPPDVEAEVISNAFTESNTLEIRVEGIIQEYEYRFDNGQWQKDNFFYNVSLGEHTVNVIDLAGCGQSEVKVMVMDYPLFFTPNGDGYNDTWNIVGMPNHWRAKVHIFDRYGKLIKQIIPNSLGWDGTFNGRPMASSDYWFQIDYLEPDSNISKTFKAHFSLKR